MYVLYQGIWTSLVLLASPYILASRLLHPDQWRHRLGSLTDVVPLSASQKNRLWIHGASVGEMGIVARLAHYLEDYSLFVSAMTPTGLERARHILPHVPSFHLPLDFEPIVKRVYRQIRPRALLVAETELWPCLIHTATRQNVKVALFNGRISERSYRQYRRLHHLVNPVIQQFALLCMQSEDDASRIVALGAFPDRVQVTGSIKFDLPTPGIDRNQWCEDLDIDPSAQIIVAGSTRPGEEEIIISAFEEVRKHVPAAFLVVAPRHLNRIPEVERIASRFGLQASRRSDGNPKRNNAILLLDTLGELLSVYGIAQTAFVGGSILPYGGHNPLEPAGHGIPVLFGPHTANCRQSATALVSSGGGIEVNNSDELAKWMIKLLRDEEERVTRGRAAKAVIQQHQGAATRTVQLLRKEGII